jgi:hypothetical protein
MASRFINKLEATTSLLAPASAKIRAVSTHCKARKTKCKISNGRARRGRNGTAIGSFSASEWKIDTREGNMENLALGSSFHGVLRESPGDEGVAEDGVLPLESGED